jgi:hypothetical protein
MRRLRTLPDFLNAAAAPTPGVLRTAPGLYFCGFHNSITGLLREISLEARRIVAIAKGT